MVPDHTSDPTTRAPAQILPRTYPPPTGNPPDVYTQSGSTQLRVRPRATAARLFDCSLMGRRARIPAARFNTAAFEEKIVAFADGLKSDFADALEAHFADALEAHFADGLEPHEHPANLLKIPARLRLSTPRHKMASGLCTSPADPGLGY
ncbi:hypothetical protein PLICRDRAFT_32682 [Plicaturopsis crispa FD-325 SS-3]|uniref:Uncharacterized protein n=1 Tax=Plicaturopsis crispa FD-325 SS-3 TaxID=944288 RepID=A0A0C9SWX4_PLICR|nr:hypothetical protein PLICRDRAFT_32682 [Plicaturopsis crispa FD-325 SS-3]